MKRVLFVWQAPPSLRSFPPLTLREVLLVHDRLPSAYQLDGDPAVRDEIDDILVRRGVLATENDPTATGAEPDIETLGEHAGMCWGSDLADEQYEHHYLRCRSPRVPVPSQLGALPLPQISTDRMLFRACRYRCGARPAFRVLLAESVDPTAVLALLDHVPPHHLFYPDR